MIIKLEHDGKSWSYDDENLTVLQGIAVEEHIKGTLVDFDQGLGSHRAVCYQALGWLVFHDGRLDGHGHADPPIATVDFPIAKLSTAWLRARMEVIEEMKAAVDAAEADARTSEAAPPGPTGGPGSAPRSGSTSARSRSSSTTSPATSTG